MRSRRSFSSRRAPVPVLVVLVLLGGTFATSALAARGVVPTLPDGPSTVATVAAATLSGSAHATAPAQGPPPAPCPRPSSEFPALWGGALPPPAVAPTLQTSACAWGTDQDALGFLSSSPGAGDRASFAIALPPAGTSVGQSLAGLEFGYWASGVPCSLDQAAEVEVQLIPPASPYDANFSADWSVRAPAYDLVPPSSCDPICSNDTALFTVAGSAFCEDQIVRDVGGAPPTNPMGGFSPGDELNLTFVGAAGSPSPLLVFVNDTTHPRASLSFSYGAGALLTGQPLTSRFSNANRSQSVWGLTPGISATALLCPWSSGPSTSCLSYNQSLEDATDPLAISAADYWNATSQNYSNSYDAVAVASSTGACAAGPIHCTGFTQPAAGFYPFWSLHNRSATDVVPVWEFGGSYPDQLRSLAVGLSPSALDGAQWATVPSAAYLGGDVVGGNIFPSAIAADPAGVASANITLDYCADGTGIASVHSDLFSGGPADKELLVGGRFPQYVGYRGPFPFWMTVTSTLGTVSGPFFGSVNVSGTEACVFPAPVVPSFSASQVIAQAGGYQVRWTEPDGSAVGYEVNASAENGSVQNFFVGDVTSANLSLESFGASFNLTVAAENVLGNWSEPSTVVAASPTREPLSVQLVAMPPPAAWLGSATLNLSGVVSGGQGPYSVELLPGDGTSIVNSSRSGNFTLLHDFGAYWGSALITVVVTDAVGDVVTAGPFVETIFATPLGVLQAATAGELVVNISYSVPASEVAPLTGFTILSTTNASLAWELEAGYASNASIPGISVWNTSAGSAEINAVDGVPLYAQVVAKNSYGVGWLPAGSGVLIVTPSPLTLTPIVAIPGGRAPFTENVSASVSGGTNDTITRAIYSFAGVIDTPAMTDVNGTTYLNATLTFESPGTFVVVLHATDIYFGTAIETTTIYVAPGVSPALSAELVTLPAYVDAPLAFQAAASGGSGSYAWNWSFGDGNYSNLADPLHSYAISGGYNVVLTVNDLTTGGFNVTTLPIIVYALPVLFVSVTPGPNGTLSYDFHAAVGGGSGPSTVVWTFGDGGVARGDTVSHDFRTAGTYLVNVSATDPAGRSGTAQFNLSAFAAPTTSTGSGTGLSSLDATLIILAAGFGILALLLAVRRPPAPPPSGGEPEDGEVSLP
jgi:PKD domain